MSIHGNINIYKTISLVNKLQLRDICEIGKQEIWMEFGEDMTDWGNWKSQYLDYAIV